jgi:hypothetical protein
VATRNAAALKPGGEGWARAEIERAVVRLVEAELGADVTRHTLDASFADDLGVD